MKHRQKGSIRPSAVSCMGGCKFAGAGGDGHLWPEMISFGPQRCPAVTEASALDANKLLLCLPREAMERSGQILQSISGAFCGVHGMLNDGEEVNCNSCSLSRNSGSEGCPTELKTNKIKPDTGEFYIHNKILLGMQWPLRDLLPQVIMGAESLADLRKN